VPSFERARGPTVRFALGAVALALALACLACWPLPTLAYVMAGLLFFVAPWFIVKAPGRT
jgi:hypothetical protein